MSCILKIKEGMNSFTETEIRLANYIIANQQEVFLLNAQQLGEMVNTSAAAVVRFSKKLGYKGFTALKVDLAKQSNTVDNDTFDTLIKKSDNLKTLVKKSEAININALSQTYGLINIDTLSKTIDILQKAKRVYIYAVGASGLVALDFQSKLARVNKMIYYIQDTHAQTITAVHLEPGDVAIGISYSGETKEVNKPMKKAKEKGASTIAITKFNNNSLSKIADYSLNIPTHEEELRIGAMTSRLAALAITDLLYLGIAKEDFSRVERQILETRQFIREIK